MNVKEYIASGIIESYVLGLLSEQERKAFETTANQYPEITLARTSFESLLEKQLLLDAHQPPVQLRDSLLEKISGGSFEKYEEQIQESHTPERSGSMWKWLALASLVLLALAAYLAFATRSENKELAAANETLREKTQQQQATLSAAQTTAKQPVSDFKMATITDGILSAKIYWDTESKDVYLRISNLPQPEQGKQYQLWAVAPDQTMTDLGTITPNQQRQLVRMKSVQEARAFAITLEPRGGSKAPTSAQMVSSEPVPL